MKNDMTTSEIENIKNQLRREYNAAKEKLEQKNNSLLRERENDLEKRERIVVDRQKDNEAERERLQKWENTLSKQREDLNTKLDNFQKDRDDFDAKKDAELKKLLALQESVCKEEKEIKTALIDAGFDGEDIPSGFEQFNKKLKDLQDKKNNLETLDKKIGEIRQKILQKKGELSKLDRKLDEKKSITISRKAAQFEKKEKIPAHTFDSEIELVLHIKDYIKGRGFYYEDGIIENFYTSLKAGYLVILSGISGVGKSKLPQLFAESIGAGFEMIPVRPDWNDDRDLLGFFNISTKKYQATRFIEFLIEANQNQDRLYIACLDEMNLAPVEYYFAQILSQMENDDPRLKPPDEALTAKVVESIQGRISLDIGRLEKSIKNTDDLDERNLLQNEKVQLENDLYSLEKYQNIPISPNIKFIGTVNMDHTTHGFSDKVLDRANVIQFSNVDIGQKLPEKEKRLVKGLSYKAFEKFCTPNARKQKQDVQTKLRAYKSDLEKINGILGKANMSVGFRVARSIESYLVLALQGQYYKNKDDHKIFDAQIKQRVLPKIQGMKSDELEQVLFDLRDFFSNNNCRSSLAKIAGEEKNDGYAGGMIRQLEKKGYVNYWELK